jgi:hypothetical protein
MSLDLVEDWPNKAEAAGTTDRKNSRRSMHARARKKISV